MSLKLEESFIKNVAVNIPEDIEMFDDSTLLVDNNGFDIKPVKSSSENKFETDHTIPSGWSKRGKGSAFFLKSPEGAIFRSRRNAFEEMLINGRQSDEEIEAMRRCLVHEGWEDREDIPDGWKIKKKAYGIFLMEQGGRMLESTSKALEFLKKYRKYYSDTDYSKMLNLAESVKGSRNKPKLKNSSKVVQKQKPQEVSDNQSEALIQEPYSFHEPLDDDTGNTGHDTIEVQEDTENSLQIDLSTSCEVTLDETDMATDNESSGLDLSRNKSSEIQHSNEPNSSKQKRNKEKVKPSHTKLSWKVDEELYPQGWKYSIAQHGENKETFHRLLSPCGKSLASVRVALGFMVTNNYPEHEIDQMRNAMLKNDWHYDFGLPEKWLYRRSFMKIQICDNLGRLFKSKDKALAFFKTDSHFSKEDYAMLEKFTSPSTLNIDNDHSWKPNEEIYPPGWKCKAYTFIGGGGGEKKFEKSMSPFGKLFGCRRAALSHMIVNQYSAEDIQKISRAVEQDGWSTSQYLPLAWTYKWRGSGTEFSNEDGICLGSKDRTLKSLRKDPVKNQNQILMIENFFKANKTDRS